MNKQPVKGSYRQLADSDFLAADDLQPGKDVLVTIAGASIEMVTSPNNKTKQMICLSFEKAKKKLALNRTNGRAIAKIAGDTAVEKWTGIKICLYRTTIKAFGDPQLPAIRVKAPGEVKQ
jgi:hypothetical protein